MFTPVICLVVGVLFYRFTLAFEVAFAGIILDQNFGPVKSFPGGESVKYVVNEGDVLFTTHETTKK